MEFIIGKKYEREFKYAFLLIRDCEELRHDYWVAGDIKEDVKPAVYYDPVIYVKSGSGNHSYRYDENVQSARFAGEDEEGESKKQGFTARGATWFALLRGDASAISPDANWQNFMFHVAAAYRKEFSVLEYKQQKGGEMSVGEAKRIATNFLKAFHPDFYKEKTLDESAVGVFAASGKDGDAETQDVYGVSLRLALNGGGGHSEYVMGKVYFETNSFEGKMKPMLHAEAKRTDELLKHFETSSEGNVDGEKGGDDGGDKTAAAQRLQNLKESVLNGLQDCVPNDKKNNFLDYLFWDESEGSVDVQTVQDLLSRTTDSTYELQCDEVKVLCISHLQWKSAAYDVYLRGVPIFRFIFDLNNSLTVKCLNCGKVTSLGRECEVLVEKNEVRLEVPAGKAVAPVSLQKIGEENFGLTNEQLETVREYGLVKLHAKVRGCKFTGKKCDGAVRCDSQVERCLDKTGKTVFAYCKNCRYPEKVYFDPQAGNGKGAEIPAYRIEFDVNTMRPIDRDASKKCKSCGRAFGSKGSKNYCNVCADANAAVNGMLGEERALEAAELYKAYAHILPVALRTFSCFKKKYCFEDDCVIVFVIGNKKYRFDKLDANDTGLLKAARKMQ